MDIKLKVISKLNHLVRKSYWFTNVEYIDCEKFWKHNTFNLDVVNLGSSSAVYAFDYSDCNVSAANWAMRPQSLLMDTAILKNYLSYLKPEATVIIPLCPFSCFVGYDIYVRDRYYTFIRHNTIPGFNIKRKNELMAKLNNPWRYYPLASLPNDIKIIVKKLMKRKSHNIAIPDMREDAIFWMRNWMYEFSISDFKKPFIQKNIDSYFESIEILHNLIGICLAHGFKPVLCIPPVSSYLSSLFSDETKQFLIFNYVSMANEYNVPFINCFESPTLQDDGLFTNSFFLNERGAKLFTHHLLKEIGLV